MSDDLLQELANIVAQKKQELLRLKMMTAPTYRIVGGDICYPEGNHVKQLMTGQEWYDRYQKELKGKVISWEYNDVDVIHTMDICKDAARKAAGLGENI